MSTIHGSSTKAIHLFREQPAALAIYWIYCARRNHEGVAYPSLRGLVRDTGWSINPCRDARDWLVENEALERIEGYVRPEWRKFGVEEQKQKLKFDKSEYYRVTGTIVVEGKSYDLLYAPGSETYIDVSPDDTSMYLDQPKDKHIDVSRHDISQGDTELSTKKEEGQYAPAQPNYSDPAFQERYLYYRAFEQGFPENARPKIEDTKKNRETAQFLYANGYQVLDVITLVQDKITEGKTEYRFIYLQEDMPKQRLAGEKKARDKANIYADFDRLKIIAPLTDEELVELYGER